jgi:hypothetical protein
MGVLPQANRVAVHACPVTPATLPAPRATERSGRAEGSAARPAVATAEHALIRGLLPSAHHDRRTRIELHTQIGTSVYSLPITGYGASSTFRRPRFCATGQ